MYKLTCTFLPRAPLALIGLTTSLLLSATAHRGLAQSTSPATASTTGATSPSNGTVLPSARPFDGIILTNEQIVQLRAATTETRAARALVLRRQPQRGRLSLEDRRELTGIADAHNARVYAILTADQRSQLEANVRAEQQRMQSQRSLSTTLSSGAP